MCKCGKEFIKEPEISLDEVIKKGPFYIATVSAGGLKGYGVAKCSALDKFSWAKGKLIAEGRARKSLLRKYFGKVINKNYEG